MIFMNKLIAFLSTKQASLLIIIISIISRIINVLFVSYYGRDKMYLILQSKSLLEGKGLAVPQYLTTDPAVPIYDFTPLWPPGYPILLAPFLKVFNYNIYWATTTVDIIFCIALLFIVRKICRQIGLSTAATNIMTIIAGCFEYTFINESLPTDLVSIVLSLLSINFLINLAASNEFSIKKIVIVSFLAFLPCLFRYNYPAISLALISGLFFIGFMKRNALLKKKSLFLFVFTGLLTASFFILMKSLTGHAGYAAPTARGFYPENIVHWFPVVPSAFINIAFLTSQAIHLANIPFNTSMQLLEVINVIAIIVLLVILLNALLRRKFLEEITPVKIFLIAGSFASIGLFVLLGYMSLTYAVQKGYANNWNYVYEPRYFAFTVLFLQIAFIAWFFQLKNSIRNLFVKVLASVCFFALFIEITHNLYFHTKVALRFKEYKSNVYREQDYAYHISLMKDIKLKYPEHQVWAAAPGDNFYQYLATYHGYIGIADANSFKNADIKVKSKTILILMVYDHEIPNFDHFLKTSKILQTDRKLNSNFYLIELIP